MAKVKRGKVEVCGVESQDKVMCQEGGWGQAADRSVTVKTGVPFGFEHMELVGDLDKSSLSQVEAHLERAEESVEGR